MNKHTKQNVLILWLAQLISGMGDAIYQIALMWLVLDLTGSAVITGLVAMSAYLPAMLFGLYAGVLTDRYNRMGIMIISNISQALTVGVIPIIIAWGFNDAILIGLLAFIRSSFSTLFPPAFNAFIPTLVKKEQLVKVNSFLTTSAQMAYFLGPALAGLLLGLIHLQYLFVFDAISFMFAIALLVLVTKPGLSPPNRNQLHPWDELKSGIKYVFNHQFLGFLLSLTIVNNLFIMGPAIVGTPILVKQALNGTAKEYAFVEAGLALGMLIGSALVFKIGSVFKNGILLTIGMVLDGLTYSIFYFANSVSTVFFLIIMHGIGIPMITISRTAIIQKQAPNNFHGRIFSMVHLAVIGMTALSSAMTGILASMIDIRIIFMFIGLGAAACGFIGLITPSLRELE
ncbi:MAG: MFS transporter [Fidelibacterota bacterium]